MLIVVKVTGLRRRPRRRQQRIAIGVSLKPVAKVPELFRPLGRIFPVGNPVHPSARRRKSLTCQFCNCAARELRSQMERQPGNEPRALLAQITKDCRLNVDLIADTDELIVIEVDEPVGVGIGLGRSVCTEPVDPGMVNRDLEFFSAADRRKSLSDRRFVEN